MVLKPHPLAATARSHLPQDHIKRATSCSENNSRSAIGIRLESDRAAERGSGTMDTRKGEWVQSAQWYLGLLSTCCCPALSSSHLPRGPGPLSSCLIHGLLSYSLKKASFQIHNNQIPQTTARIMPVDFHSCSLVLTTFSFSRESVRVFCELASSIMQPLSGCRAMVWARNDYFRALQRGVIWVTLNEKHGSS